MELQSGELLFGRYRAGDLVRQGRFSRVYRVASEAPQSGALEVQAVKIIFRDAPGLTPALWEDYQKRFAGELELAGRFSHPNVLGVAGFDQDEEKLALGMALASGGNLADRLNQARQAGQPAAFDKVIRIARDAALGLEAIHLLGLVHRNIKPANLLLSGQERVWVADLGQAQTPEEAEERQAGRLATRHPGTLAYMSPEQETKTGALTPASDIYTLGLVFFELFTGRNYKNVRAGTQASGLRPDIPAWIDTLLAQMLAPAPAERVSDGGSLVRRLQDGARQAQQQHPQGLTDQARADELSQQEADRQRALEEAEQQRRKEEEHRLADRLLKERTDVEQFLRVAEWQKGKEESRVQASQKQEAPPPEPERSEPPTVIEPLAKPVQPAPQTTRTLPVAEPQRTPTTPAAAPLSRPGLSQKPHFNRTAWIVVGISVLVLGVCSILAIQGLAKIGSTQTTAPTSVAEATAAPTEAPATKAQEPTQAPAAEPIRLTMWYPLSTGAEAEKNALQGLVDSYTQLHPNVTVNLEFIDSSTLVDRLTVASAAGQPPDLALTYASEIRKLIAAGQIIPLDAYVGSGKLDHFLPIALQNSTIDGHLYVLPERMFSMGLLYNKKMVSEPPATTDSLLFLIKKGNRTIIFQVSYFLFGFLTTQGGTVDWQTDGCGTDRTGLVDAVRYLKQLKDAGAVFTSDYNQIDTEFSQGTAAMTVNGSWSINTYTSALGENLGVAPIPAGKTLARPLTGIDGYVISRASLNQAAVADLALYLTSADAVTQMTDIVGSLPSRDDVTPKNPLMNDFMRIAQQGLPVVPTEDKLEQFYTTADQVIPGVLDGSLSPEDAVDRVCRAVGS